MLELINVCKTYSNKTVINNVSLVVSQGEIVGLLGPNGSGKTTLMKLVTGIERPTSGDILINGHSIITEPLAAKKYMSYIADIPYLYNLLTGREYLHFMADMWKLSATRKKENTNKYLQLLGLDHLADEVIGQYSLGTKQKIALAGALVHDPKIVIMDEPLTGIDVVTSKDIEAMIKCFASEGGTVFVSTHLMNIVEEICTKIAVFSKGNVLAYKEIAEITMNQDVSLEDVIINWLEANNTSNHY